MKKTLLLGTTALIAAGVATSGAAQAQEEPITAGIGGYFVSAIGFLDQDSDDGQLADTNNSVAMSNDIELTVSGSTTLDNGITAGFSAQIEGNTGDTAGTGSAALDERFVFFRGGFGEVRFGQTESAREAMSHWTPNGAGIFGINSPFFTFAERGQGVRIFNITTHSDDIGRQDGITLVYYSPTFNGFRIGASYNSTGGNNDAYGFFQNGIFGDGTNDGDAAEATGPVQNHTAIGAAFTHDFGDITLSIAGGWEGYVLERCNADRSIQNCENNPETMNLGGTISFGEWAIGTSWLEADRPRNSANGSGRTREDWDVAIAWHSGPYGLGLMYGEAEKDVAADNTTDTLQIAEINASYVIGPGIDFDIAITNGEYDDASVNGLDNDFTELKVGAALWF